MNSRFALQSTSCLALITALGLLWPAAAPARIKLITLPLRERVEIQLDHPSVTLVEEERIVPLVKTAADDEPNQVDFSWANTAIDPETIVFRVIGPAAGEANAGMQIRVHSVSYPPNEQALVWQVAASKSGAARVRISYVLGNLSKSFNYRAVAAHDVLRADRAFFAFASACRVADLHLDRVLAVAVGGVIAVSQSISEPRPRRAVPGMGAEPRRLGRGSRHGPGATDRVCRWPGDRGVVLGHLLAPDSLAGR